MYQALKQDKEERINSIFKKETMTSCYTSTTFKLGINSYVTVEFFFQA